MASPRLLVVASPGTEVTILEVFEQLRALGVELVFAYGRREGKLPPSFVEQEGVSLVQVPLERQGPGSKSVNILRQAANAVRFMDPALESGRWARFRTSRHLLKALRHPDSSAAAERALDIELPARMHKRLTGALRDLERLLPPHAELEEAVRAVRADALVLVSRFGLRAVEPDVLKVARRLDLPVVLVVWSWDNLSSKAMLNEHPDHVLVWNEVQAREATAFHGVPPERVHVLGAPIFDRFFELLPDAPAEPATAAETTLLYLGSSPNVAADEAPVCDRWIAAVRGSDDERLRAARIVIRPHPANHSWDAWQPPDDRTSVVTSRKLEPTRLIEELRAASAVVALNTSAEIEAAIAGRPVLTFRAGDAAPGQEGSLHFEHLLEQRGGFVIDAADLDEHVANLSRVIRGDYEPERLRSFVERFARPKGLDRPVAPIVASTIVSLAAGRLPDPVAR